MTANDKEKKISRNIRSFEADEDVNELLKMAQEDGVTVGEICNRAIKAHGLSIVREILAEHRQRHERWEKPVTEKTLTSKEAKAAVGAGSSVASRLAQESGSKQKAESPSENKSSRAASGHGRRR